MQSESESGCTWPSSWTATAAGRHAAGYRACRSPRRHRRSAPRQWNMRPILASTLSHCMRSRRTTGHARRGSAEHLPALRAFLRIERDRLRARGEHLEVIGRRDRLPAPLLRGNREGTESTTAGATDTLKLRVAIDYSSREPPLPKPQAGSDRFRSSQPLTSEQRAHDPCSGA